jgi:hypothetical protein
MRTNVSLRRTIAAALFAAAFVPGSALADGVDPLKATPVQKYQAQVLFVRGRDLAAKKKCKDAVVEFRASLNIVASPNARFALARCLVDMDLPLDAWAELTKTAADARLLAAKEARYSETADAADAEKKELLQKIVLLTLKVDHMTDDTTVKIADKDVPRDALAAPIPLMPGAIEIVVYTAGKEVARTSLAVGPGETTVTMDAQPPPPKPPEPPPQPPRPVTQVDPNDVPKDDLKKPPPPPPPAPNTTLRTGAYIAGGVGVVGFGLFAIFGALEKGTYSDLQSACHSGPCPASKQDDVSTGKSQQTIANIGLVVGAVGVATGVTLFILSRPKAAPGTNAAKIAPPPTVSIVASPMFIGVRGSL